MAEYEKFKRLVHGVETGNCDVLEVYDAWALGDATVRHIEAYFNPETMRDMGYKHVKVIIVNESLEEE